MTRSSTLITAFAFALTAACGASDDASKNDRPKELGIELPSAVANPSETAMTAPVPLQQPPAAAPAKPAGAQVPAPEPTPTPTTYRELMAQGKRAYAGGDYDDALEMFAAASAKHRTSATARIEIARTLLGMGRVAKARDHAEAGIELAPSSSYAWNTLGRIELAEGSRAAAVASFERSVELDNDNSYAWNNLGLTVLQLERYEDAVGALEAATSGANPKAYMWNNLGMAYEHLDRIVEARAAYRQAADDGSSKGAASLERLEGVVSLVPARVEVDVEIDSVDLDADTGIESTVQ